MKCICIIDNAAMENGFETCKIYAIFWFKAIIVSSLYVQYIMPLGIGKG